MNLPLQVKGLSILDKRAAIRKLIESFADEVLTDQGDEAIRQVLEQSRHFHRYSFANTLLILAQTLPEGTRQVAGIRAWDELAKKQGHQPKRIRRGRRTVDAYTVPREGSSAVWIFGFSPRKREYEDPETGETIIQELRPFHPLVRVWRVEDMVYRDTGEPVTLPDYIVDLGDDAAVHLDALLSFAEEQGIEVELYNVYQARGLSSGGRIVLQAGDPPGKLLPVAIHELAHEFLHPREDRDGTVPEVIIEGEAEATAAVVLRWLGYDTPLSAAYLRSHGASRELVLQSLNRIRAVSLYILAGLEKHSGHRPQVEWRVT